jgi:type II secretory ATPase GspE/PulE/Tfp pilus assembly ATPase PilB-like protein
MNRRYGCYGDCEQLKLVNACINYTLYLRLCFILLGMSQDARLDEEQATQRRARVLGLDYVDTSRIENKVLYRDTLSIEELRNTRVIPIREDKSNILFGVTTTTSQQTMISLRQRFLDQRIAFAIMSDTGFRDYMNLYDPPKEIVYHDISIEQTGKQDSVEEVSNLLEQVRADDMLAYLVAQAHRLNASDIHIETQVDDVRIRLRIDGVLHPIARLNMEKYRVLISAIASAGNVSTASNEAQQGHIAQKLTMADGNLVDVNVRLETVPTVNNMDVVMRLFNMDKDMYTLDRLGLTDDERKVVDDIIAKPSGLVMVVGPTGSGKTTTLYSMLNTLNTDERKIITIEDPVEYQFPGITQIPIHTTEGGNDGSFAEKLRAVLRLDPDIVMVGEIRDLDTAKTALQAALTGHLVLATFHASTASAALTRISDIIGQNPLFVSAIRLVMAQRLIRKLDDSIKESYDPSENDWQLITGVLDTLPPGFERPNLDGLKLYKPGKSDTNPYGFQGQIAIREQFVMTDKLRELLENPHNKQISSQSIEAAAAASGMHTMLQDGMLKVVAGQTTLDELYRVVG